MSGVHKYPTVSFRVSPSERKEIEAKIKVSGLAKKDYYIRSCIYNRVCVVGKKEVIYELVEEVKKMHEELLRMEHEGLLNVQEDSMYMLKAILWMLDGAKYLWEEK